MEENRLTPMGNYDVQLFNRLYNQTETLRRRIAAQIDYRRFGLEYEDILSWLSVKFIFVFNKYHKQKNEDLLLGFIINSLRMFKFKIMKRAYKPEFSQNILSYEQDELDIPVSMDTYQEDPRFETLDTFMKDHLSPNAYTLFHIQLNPPSYIIKNLDNGNPHKIPHNLICDYLDIEYNTAGIKYVENLQKEIKTTVSYAKYHFSNNN